MQRHGIDGGSVADDIPWNCHPRELFNVATDLTMMVWDSRVLDVADLEQVQLLLLAKLRECREQLKEWQYQRIDLRVDVEMKEERTHRGQKNDTSLALRESMKNANASRNSLARIDMQIEKITREITIFQSHLWQCQEQRNARHLLRQLCRMPSS